MSAWYLVYLLSYSTSGGFKEVRYVMPSHEACLKSVEAAQVHVPQGGDAESTVTIFCAQEKQE